MLENLTHGFPTRRFMIALICVKETLNKNAVAPMCEQAVIPVEPFDAVPQFFKRGAVRLHDRQLTILFAVEIPCSSSKYPDRTRRTIRFYLFISHRGHN